MTTISHLLLKRNYFLLLALHLLCTNALGGETYKIRNPAGSEVIVKLAISSEEHTLGLSGIKAADFKNSMGMLFINSEMGPRRFWMPDTYFNLDIIFLDTNLKVVGIEKNAPQHAGKIEPPTIYKTDTYQAQYVLEIKAGAPFGKSIKKNDSLKFIGPYSLSEIVLKTHQRQ